jgi:hypothetical protein
MSEKVLENHYKMHIVPSKLYIPNLCQDQKVFTAFLASLFQPLGIPLVVYAESELLWLHSLCYRIALDHDAHKLPCNPYIQSMKILAIVVFLAFSLMTLEICPSTACRVFSVTVSNSLISRLYIDKRESLSHDTEKAF